MSDDASAPLLIYGIVRADAFAPNDVSDLGPGWAAAVYLS